MDMDLPKLAGELVTYLTPFLPYLQQAGGKVADELVKKVGEGVWERVQTLWGKLRPQVPAHEVESWVEHPDEPLMKGPVQFRLQEILKANPELAGEVAELLKAAGPRANWIQVGRDAAIAIGDGTAAATHGGIAATGDVVIGAPWPGLPGGSRDRE